MKADDVRHGVVMVRDLPVSEVFPYSRFDPEKAVHLVVFPWAGASALSCLRLCSVVGEAVGVLAVEMAGRGTRSDEPTVRTVEEVATEVTSALVDITDTFASVVVAGHSLGAALAYETASQMSMAGLAPAGVILSGRAPHRVPSGSSKPWKCGGCPEKPDDVYLVDFLRRTGSADEIASLNECQRREVLDRLRSDLVMNMAYVPELRPVGFPMFCLTGREDMIASPEACQAWCNYTAGYFELVTFAGGHFYFKNHGAEVIYSTFNRIVHLIMDWCVKGVGQ